MYPAGLFQIYLSLLVFEYLKGHVWDVNQLVVGESQHIQEAQLCESPRLDLLDTIIVQMQLLQGGEAVKGFLQQ